MSDKRYCMSCMGELEPGAVICPHCNYSTDLDNKATQIAQGLTICSRYLIGKAITTNDDCVIYIALDKNTGKTVTVYEFYPESLATREEDRIQVAPVEEKLNLYDGCLQSFLGLWRGIRMFTDVKCLPCVTDIIEENGTAYAVTDYKESVALKDYFAKTRKPLTANKAVSAFNPVLNALKLLHGAGIVHGNLNPSTIQVGADGRLNIVGFSIPQCRSNLPEIAARPVTGFSPIEIYQGNGATAQSDIYSVMSVMYYSVTGIVLPRATERVINSKLSMPAAVAQNLQRPMLDAFSKALAVHPNERIGKIDELIGLLNGTATQSGTQPVHTAPITPAAPAPTKETYSAPDYNGETQVIKTPIKATPPKVTAPKPVQQTYRGHEEYIDENDYNEEDYKDDTLIERKHMPLPLLGGLTFVSVILVCFILFAILYTTVLYKSIEVPMFDNMFSSLSFLPMNKDDNDANDYNDDYYDETDNLTEDSASSDTTYVTVPDFTKFTEDYIRSNANFLNNFDLMFDYESSSEVEKGGVISQSIHKNESVLTGTVIRLVISTGQPEIAVPDVLDKTYDEAKKILTSEGFKVSKEVIENPEKNPADTVSNMSVQPGMLAPKGSEIILYIWDEVVEESTTEPEVTVPDVIGKTFSEARKVLVKEGFKVSKEIVKNTKKMPADTVSNMSIQPGMTAPKGSEIVLFIWDKVEEETTTTEPTTTEPTTEEPTTTEPTTTEPTTTEPTTRETTTTEPTTEETTSEVSTSEVSTSENAQPEDEQNAEENDVNQSEE